jgi:thiamine biosynthesis protein ThiS
LNVRNNLLRLEINGERRELAAGLSLEELVQFLKLKPEQIAIELNQAVVRRTEWASTELKEDDRVEIVHFVGGGTCPILFQADRV